MRVFRSMMVPSLMLSFVACDPAIGESGTTPLVRDSAGITIVENVESLWAPAEAWRLSAEPALRIGMMSGPEAYQLYRVADATRLPDGRIVVANAGTSELRYFDAEGRHLASAGGSGGGPGEFQALIMVEQLGDSVVAFDRSSRRMSIFTRDGAFVRSFPVGEGIPSPGFRPWGRFADGTIAYGGVEPPLPTGDRAPTPGRSATTALYLRLGADGAVVDSLGRFAGPDWITRMQDASGRMTITVTQLLFAANPHLVAGPRGFVFSPRTRYELAYHAADGRLERLVRRPHPPQRVTEEHLRLSAEAQRQAALGRAGSGPVPSMLSPDEVPHAEYLPAFETFTLDAAGNVWVSEYRRPGHEGPVNWDVFDPEGSWLGSVSIHEGHRVLEIGDDYLLTLWRDDLDVEYVQLYGLIKP